MKEKEKFNLYEKGQYILNQNKVLITYYYRKIANPASDYRALFRVFR